MYFKVGRFTSTFLVWSLLSFLWVSQLHPLAIIAGLFAAVCFFFQDRLELGRKGIGISLIACLLICFLCTRTIDRDATGMFLGIGTMSLSIMAAILLGGSLIMKKSGELLRGPLMTGCALLVGCSMSLDMKTVALITSVGVLLLILSLREAMRLESKAHLIAPLLITFALLGSTATVLTWSERQVSYLARLFAFTPHTGFSFPAATSLSSLQRWHGDDVVVLRGYGDNPPLYLKGRTFTEFDNKNFWRWQTDKEVLKPVDQVLVETGEGPKSISVFNRITGDELAGEYFRVEYPRGGGGFTFYAPSHFHSLSVDLGRIHRYGDGMLQALAKDECPASYYLFPFTNGWVRQGDAEPISDELREACLALPDNVSPVVSQLGEEIAGKVDDPGKKADFITNFLHQHFEYGYEYPFESSETALEEFLTKRPPAHCEFFATSAALLLRSQGVPTRYINGFVMQEKSLTGNYYVVRLKHAHAWIEAYVPGKGWVTYDPTPPGTLGDPETKAGTAAALLEWVSNGWRKLTNFFTLSPGEMFQRVRAFIAGFTWFDYLKLLALVGLWWGWKKLRGRRRKRRRKDKVYTYEAGRDDRLTPILESLSEAFEDEEWQRTPAETPAQWVQRLEEAGLSTELLSSLKQFARDYTRLRFSDNSENSEVERLSEQVAELQRELSKS